MSAKNKYRKFVQRKKQPAKHKAQALILHPPSYKSKKFVIWSHYQHIRNAYFNALVELAYYQRYTQLLKAQLKSARFARTFRSRKEYDE